MESANAQNETITACFQTCAIRSHFDVIKKPETCKKPKPKQQLKRSPESRPTGTVKKT